MGEQVTCTLVRPASGGLGLTLGVKYPGNNVRIAATTVLLHVFPWLQTSPSAVQFANPIDHCTEFALVG